MLSAGFVLVVDLQIKYPENFFLLRGNHECASINRIYGFYDECKRRYSIRLWRTFTDCFNCLPVAALIDEKVRNMSCRKHWCSPSSCAALAQPKSWACQRHSCPGTHDTELRLSVVMR